MSAALARQDTVDTWKQSELWGGATGAPPPWPPDPTERPEVGRPGRAKRAAAGLAAALAMVVGGYGIRAATGSSPQPAAQDTTSSTAASTPVSSTGDVSALVARAEKAVVRVTSEVVQQGPFGQVATGQAVGTGFIVRSDGLILTNYHVVESGQNLTVTLSDGRQLSATLVKSEPSADLAVLRIDANGMPTLTLGNSSQVQAGQAVVAIGYALGLEGSPTVTTGIVSATGRTIQVLDDGSPTGPVVRTYRDALQISAAINSGNSGGPLLDLQGRVIGIDSAGSSSADNIGFAIPIDQAKALVASVG